MLGKMSLLSYMGKRCYSHKINSRYINISHEMSSRFSRKLPSGQNKAGNTAAFVILKFYNPTGDRKTVEKKNQLSGNSGFP